MKLAKKLFSKTGYGGDFHLNTWNVKGKYGQRLYRLIQDKNKRN